MSKIVLFVSHDNKSISQVGRWLKELPEDIIFESASNIEELNEKYLNHATERAQDAEPENPLRVLIFDVSMFGANDPVAFISQTRDTLKPSIFCSGKTPPRVMVLTFDHAPLPLSTFVHPDVDDLMMKPLDRDLFMQKVGMMLADNVDTNGTYLFKQKANFVVEMAKDARIVKLGEFGLAISNPTALAPGVFAHLYSPIFGTKQNSSVWARVFNTRRDPKVPGNFLCFFTFFGIGADQMMSYRKVLRDRRKELHWHQPPFQSDIVPAVIRHVAVIDRNPAISSLVTDALRTNFVNVKVYPYSSYSKFLKAVSGAAASVVPVNAELPEGVEKSPAFKTPQMTFFISAENGELLRTEPAPKDGLQFCGVELLDLQDSPAKWLSLIADFEKEEWDEFLLTLQRGHKTQAVLHFKDELGQFYGIQLRGEVAKMGDGESQRILRIDMRELNDDELKVEHERRNKESTAFSQIDAVYIDALSIRDFASWYEGLRELLSKSNLLIGDKFAAALLVDEKSTLAPVDYRNANVGDFIFKPIDRRLLTAKAAVLIKDLVVASEDVDLNFTPVDLPVRIAKEVELEEVAEYGLQIKTKVPLREGIFLRFFSPLFLDETGEGVLARCTACIANPNAKDSYSCFFTFFGVSDAQLKHIRQWIREDYVHKKESEAG